MAARDPNAFRFAVPVLLVLAFAVSWGEWTARLDEAFAPLAVPRAPVAARIDAWIDPPAYTHQAPVFLTRRTDAPSGPISVPEGSKLSVRIVSHDAAQVTLATKVGTASR